jgi:pSer/pThr/pTyr-binding forkhead associated (FHA) protein
MKVNLVVTAAGPNQGRAIPIVGAKFLIGRDPHCNLRPASQAISKQHCAIHIRNGQVFIEDLSSTNGTVVNNVVVEGEKPLMNGDEVRVGPLEFRVEIVPLPTPADGTPLPNKLTPLAADLGQPKPTAKSTPAQKPAAKSTPAQKPAPSNPAQKPVSGKSTPAQKPAATAPAPVPPPKLQPEPIKPASSEGDDAAAMLLGMDDEAPSGEQPNIPDGSTVMEIPLVDASGRLVTPPKPEKKSEAVESASAASDLLKKYFRRTSS